MNASQIAQNYASHFRCLKEEWCNTGPQNWTGNGLLEAAAVARDEFHRLSFEEIASLEDCRSFWINTYNGAVTELIITLAIAAALAIAAGVRRSVKEIGRFFEVKHLKVADVPLSLDDIEHGFLRANRHHPAGLLPPLLCRPHLKAWMVRHFDPRIHFALNCGGRSCPPMEVYTAAEIDCQLDRATTAFLKTEVKIDPHRSIVRANPILRWYRADFADLGGLEGLIRRYRPGELDERCWRFTWKKYDWRLWPEALFPLRQPQPVGTPTAVR
ncbi:MAG: DUF547 domain-containing protein [Candidatus Latescibacteria bacterium]|nr:DUF547 domain-containing protein [Candidatus Latescibacterota bacterium]